MFIISIREIYIKIIVHKSCYNMFIHVKGMQLMLMLIFSKNKHSRFTVQLAPFYWYMQGLRTNLSFVTAAWD